MRVEFGRAPAPSTPRRRSRFRPRRRRFRAGNRCGGASPRVMNAARSCFRKTAARVRNDSLLRHAVVETPGMQQRPAARSLRRDGARRPAVPRWAPFSELSRKKSQRTVSTVEDVERPNHVRVELSRVAGAGRCHSTGLLSGAQLGWRRLISERALSYEDLSVSGPSAAAVHSGCAALSRTAADGRLCSRSKQFAPRPRSPGS